MNKHTNIALALSLFLPAGGVLTAQPMPSPDAPTPMVQPVGAGAHLGVTLQTVPPALAAQLPSTLSQGQGVMIVQVQPDSPAAEAGVQAYDILLSYDDQKLFSADQLKALVSADQPGRDVTLKLVRGGRLQEIQVELGQGAQQSALPQPWHSRSFHFPRHGLPAMPEQLPETVTESFESLSVKRLEDGRYRAEIEYLDAAGTKKSHVFEGTREDLNGQINQSADLPPAARKHLLNALNMRGGWPMPRFWRPFEFEKLMRAWREGDWMQY